MKILAVMGTRPEVVKMAPVIKRLSREKNIRLRLCVTAQHRGLLDLTLRAFCLRPHIDLNLMRPEQSPSAVLCRVIAGMDKTLRAEKPDLLLVQGDTTTVLGAALAAFDLEIPIAHVEAGLRSHDLANPYPEEGNRVTVDHLARLLFAPTALARRNLIGEGIGSQKITLTGNTVVDALVWAARRRHRFEHPALRALDPRARLVVVTLHRRESFGAPLERVLRAVADAAERLPALTWIYPVHPNPHVLRAARLLRSSRVRMTPPLGYLDFIGLMKRAEFVVTDSGGVQEEAATLGKRVLVIREKTERPEILGREGILIGTSKMKFLKEVGRLEKSRGGGRRSFGKTFGDGRASEKIARAILSWSKGLL